MDRRKREKCLPPKTLCWGEGLPWHHVVWVVLAALAIGVLLYSAALKGGFVFDDEVLPFRRTTQNDSIGAWLSGVRPFLMFTYWLNYLISGQDPYSYHAVNLFIHALNAGLVFVVLFRLMAMAGWSPVERRVASALGTAIFLIHPLATESVSYVAGRSESLAAFFMLLAYAIFLTGYPEPISWKRSALVLALFGLGVATKENAAGFVAVLLLTDLFWPRPFSMEGVRRNRKLYTLMAPGVAAAGALVVRVLAGANTAGFLLKDFTWYQYGFTQARAIVKYLRLSLIPIGQSVDHDFPISRTITAHGAIVYLALLAALTVMALAYRRRYPLACFGWILFLVLLAPTSSIIPIVDPLVERRMYLPMVGLVLIGCEIGRRRWSNSFVSLLVATILIFGVLCYQRNQLWAKPARLWEMAAMASEKKGRPYYHLAENLIAENRCADALPYLVRGERLMPQDFSVQVAWGRVLECVGRREEALARLKRAARIRPGCSVYQWIGLLYGEMGRMEEARTALLEAVRLGPRDSAAHSALGLWYESVGNTVEAEREYRMALGYYAYNREALAGLGRIQQ